MDTDPTTTGGAGPTGLAAGNVGTRLPAQDLDRARRWYSEKLGLEPTEERPGGLRYQIGDTYFALFTSAGAPSGEHTQMGWEVDDLDDVVEDLRSRGVEFEAELLGVPAASPVEVLSRQSGAHVAGGQAGRAGAARGRRVGVHDVTRTR